jgi:flagellar hook-length control protein FliK
LGNTVPASADGNNGGIFPSSGETERTAETLRGAGARPKPQGGEPNPAPPRLSVPLSQESAPQDISRFMNMLRGALTEIRGVLTAEPADSPAAAQVLQETSAILSQIDFMSQIKNPLFVQIPLLHDGQEMQATLHILRNPKRENEGKNNASALIALDTASLGLFEALVQKNANAVTCQFRLRDEQVEQLVRANIHALGNLLNEKHYSLNGFSFLPRGEPYTVLDSPAPAEDIPAVDVRAFDRRA